MDVPLNPMGVLEAEAMGKAMTTTDIDKIYCSDLDRADHTAQVIAKHHGLTPIARQWFRPLNYGDLTGKSISEIQPKLDELNEIWKTNPDFQAPGGESFTEFQDRNLSGLYAILKNAQPGEQIMVVAHLRNCLLFHGVALNEAPLEGAAIQQMDGKKWHQPSGSISKFEYGDEENAPLLRFVGIIFKPNEKEEQGKTPVPDEGSSVLSETAVEDRPMLESNATR